MPQSVVIVPHLKASPVPSPPALHWRVHIRRVHRHLPTHHYLLNQVVPVQFSDYWPWQMRSTVPVHQQSRLLRWWGTVLISMSNCVRCALMPKLPPCIISTYMPSRTGWMCHPFLMMLLCQTYRRSDMRMFSHIMMMILPSRQILLS